MSKYLFPIGVVVAILLYVVFHGKREQKVEEYNMQTARVTAATNCANMRINSLDDLLPPELQEDPWGTKFRYKIKKHNFMLWSAGPDKEFGIPSYGDDDIVMFQSSSFSLNQDINEILAVLRKEHSEIVADVLSHSGNNKLAHEANKLMSRGHIILVYEDGKIFAMSERGEVKPVEWLKEKGIDASIWIHPELLKDTTRRIIPLR